MVPSAVAILIVSAVASADLQLDIDYAAQLRDRGLFRLSQIKCQQLLARSELEPDVRNQLAIELAKTLSAQALHSRSPQREAFFQQAFASLDAAFAESDASSAVLVQTQKSLTTLLQAEWARREAEVRASSDEDWQSARTLLREAISQLKQVETELRSAALGSNSESGPLSRARMEELLRNVQLQLAIGFRNQAITYANKPNDRVNSLTLAIEKLEPLASSRVVDSLVWQSRVERVRCYRLLNDAKRTSELLSQVDNAPTAFMSQFAAEGVRLALSVDQPEAALALIERLQHSHANVGPELILAEVETMVVLAELAAKKEAGGSEAKSLQKKGLMLASTLSKEHGTYWGLRGEMTLAKLADQPVLENKELLATAAKTYLQRDLADDAAAMFGRAAEKADKAGDFAHALEYQKQAAAVDQQQGKLQESIGRLRQAALKYASQTEAAEAHLTGIFHAASLYQQLAGSTDGPKSLAQYRAMLDEHIENWADRPTADQARLWSARLLQATRDWPAAIKMYQAIGPTSPQSRERYVRLYDLYDRSGFGADESRAWFDEQLRHLPVGSDELTEALIIAAKLRLFHEPYEYLQADKSLKRVLSTLSPASPDWARVHSLLVIAAAGRGQMSIAATEMRMALPLPANLLSPLLAGLQTIRDRRPDDAELASMMTDVAGLLKTHRQNLSVSELLLLDEAEADSLRQSAPSEATARYAALAQSHPKNARIQREYAELLSQGTDRASREQALAQWRIVVRKSPPRSLDWFRAKLGVATIHFELGQRKQAKELIDLLLSLHPSLGGAALKSQFLQLRERCN